MAKNIDKSYIQRCSQYRQRTCSSGSSQADKEPILKEMRKTVENQENLICDKP